MYVCVMSVAYYTLLSFTGIIIVFVTMPSGHTSAYSSAKLSQLKAEIWENRKVPPEIQRLFYNHKAIVDDEIATEVCS